jgi:RNA polymerase sigma-70 factor (ECF subfamily)
VVDAFFAASRDGDFEALLEVLDPEIELRIDGGARPDATLILRGAAAVAGYTTTYSALFPFVHPALVNGAPGAVVARSGKPFSVMGFTVTNGRIVRIQALIDPERLARLDLDIPLQGQ